LSGENIVTVHPVEASLELAAMRCGDLTPIVYAKLFADYPAMEALFVRDTTGAVKGEMLARVLEAILDFVGENSYGANMIRCEVVTHAGYDVPPDVFGIFFGVVATTIREQLAENWTEAFDRAWRTLLSDLDYFVTHPDQKATPGQ
jgi:hemoglobin-like flavoprotein